MRQSNKDTPRQTHTDPVRGGGGTLADKDGPLGAHCLGMSCFLVAPLLSRLWTWAHGTLGLRYRVWEVSRSGCHWPPTATCCCPHLTRPCSKTAVRTITLASQLFTGTWSYLASRRRCWEALCGPPTGRSLLSSGLAHAPQPLPPDTTRLLGTHIAYRIISF